MAKRRFQATEHRTRSDLRRIIVEKLGASSWNMAESATGSITVSFDRKGQRYRFDCSQWPTALENLRAIGLRIDYMVRALNYGVTSSKDGIGSEAEFNRLFLGFRPAPDDSVLMIASGTRDWWEVLGIQRGEATADAVRNAYRSLALTHHPDHGGNAEEFKRLVRAYKEGIAEVEK